MRLVWHSVNTQLPASGRAASHRWHGANSACTEAAAEREENATWENAWTASSTTAATVALLTDGPQCGANAGGTPHTWILSAPRVTLSKACGPWSATTIGAANGGQPRLFRYRGRHSRQISMRFRGPRLPEQLPPRNARLLRPPATISATALRRGGVRRVLRAE